MSFPSKVASLCLALALAAVGGFLSLLLLAAHHPHQAPFLRILAFVWLVGVGASKMILDLTETAGREEPRRAPSPSSRKRAPF